MTSLLENRGNYTISEEIEQVSLNLAKTTGRKEKNRSFLFLFTDVALISFLCDILTEMDKRCNILSRVSSFLGGSAVVQYFTSLSRL